MVASTPLMLVVHPSTPANNVKELIALLKASPGKYSYGSSGTGTIVHLASEMLKASAGVDALHVPYKGSNPATAAILGGEVTFVFSTMPPAISNAKAGKLRALAVTTAARGRAGARGPDHGRGRRAQLRDRAVLRHPGPEGHGRCAGTEAQRRVREGRAGARDQERLREHRRRPARHVAAGVPETHRGRDREVRPGGEGSGAKVE
jgi:hypothetical protein